MKERIPNRNELYMTIYNNEWYQTDLNKFESYDKLNQEWEYLIEKQPDDQYSLFSFKTKTYITKNKEKQNLMHFVHQIKTVENE